MQETPIAPAPDWWVYRGSGSPHDGIRRLPPAPPWRALDAADEYGELPPPPVTDDANSARRLGRHRRATAYVADDREIHLVNLALYLRRPLLVTGRPGVGKSTLAYSVAHELRLGPVLRWPIGSRSTLQDGLYTYDAIARLQDAGLHSNGGRAGGDPSTPPGIGPYLRLGPLGTALLPWRRPRVLLVDEIDKSDIDLPNDLLDVFEEGEFTIPELSRLGDTPHQVMSADDGQRVTVKGGRLRSTHFPFVVLTSNGEREFPPAFLRRCVRLEIPPADERKLASIVAAHFPAAPGEHSDAQRRELIAEFLRKQQAEGADLASDQLLNAMLMAAHGLWSSDSGQELIRRDVFRPLNEG
ncbi:MULTISPECIES: MoxR family ATPase [unclassified Streptomyces]|uniref:AAA family ATPase n=1 Tax=unclassified Streptomyces TaxID=2593676 RepID=UPI002DDB0D1B|nr:MoxR family ATPase [Streptomyces sp. NBC_00243]WRZ18992.1 MoxR family ATPase [Streptomyces sp. NBC_00243]